MAETILPANIVEETRRRYLTYALSVITGARKCLVHARPPASAAVILEVQIEWM